jgi:transcription termination factor 2
MRKWTLKEIITNRLMVSERKVLRKIFGPTNENGIWRIKTNQELNKIIKHKNIIIFIRAQRLGWLGHIERMQETRMVKAIYCWKPISRRPTGRPKPRWEDDVRKDIQKSKVPNWETLVQDRRRWKEMVEKAKTLLKEL